MNKLVKSLLKNSTISAHQGYRKLQFFTGGIPIPGGEEGFESLMDQTIQAVEKLSIPEVVKRQRILLVSKVP